MVVALVAQLEMMMKMMLMVLMMLKTKVVEVYAVLVKTARKSGSLLVATYYLSLVSSRA